MRNKNTKLLVSATETRLIFGADVSLSIDTSAVLEISVLEALTDFWSSQNREM